MNENNSIIIGKMKTNFPGAHMQCNFIIQIESEKIFDQTLRISRAFKKVKRGIHLVSTFITTKGPEQSGEALLVLRMSLESAGELKQILQSTGVTSSRLYQHFDW